MSGTAAPSPAAAVASPHVEASPVAEFLQLLARAVQQFRTYPPASPLCRNAIDACTRALVMLEDRDQVVFRVSPRELIVDETPIGRDTIVEHELARRLHTASIADVSIDRAASPRELSHLCLDLVRCSSGATDGAALIDLLADHGVGRIALGPARQPEVLVAGAPSEAITGLINVERRRREALFARGGAVSHLYPPDRGWVRLDPAVDLESVSLVDLALLAEDPAALAAMLVRLTDEGTPAPPAESLLLKFSDVALLFSALEPRIARVMFSKLAHAVLALDADARQALLRRAILPGLLDGRVDGVVLRDFPDLELADSLCLLMDLETAAPEVVSTALARLELPDERQAVIVPLVERRLSVRAGASPVETGLEVHARKLVNIERDRARSFADFSAFDLALDAQTAATLAQIRDHIAADDVIAGRLGCLWQLTRLEPNPEVAQGFVESAASLLLQLERDSTVPVFASWLLRYRDLADALVENRPDVGRLIAAILSRMCTPGRALRLADLAAAGGDARAAADDIVRALAPEIGLVLLEAARTRPADAKDDRARAAVLLLCHHASIVAPALVEMAVSAPPAAQRVIARVLGSAGPGYEAPLGAELESGDELTVREALRSLARIGTTTAAALVSALLDRAGGWMQAAAEETLWRFPPAEAHRQGRALLARREFVMRHPEVALRLIDRLASSGAGALEPVLRPLISLRWRLWSPALARVGRQARAVVTK
jgi:hypothetical protein